MYDQFIFSYAQVVELSNVLFNKMQAKQFKLSDECEADECLLEEYKREIFSLAAVGESEKLTHRVHATKSSGPRLMTDTQHSTLKTQCI